MTLTKPEPRQAALPTALVVAGLLLIAANLRAGITTIGPVLADLQRDLDLSSLAASILISLPLLAFAIISPITPALTRRLGLEQSLGLGLAGLIVGLVVRSLPGAAMLWLGTALLGIAIAVLNVALPTLVKRDFPTRIGQLTGAYSSVQAIFAAIAAGIAIPVAHATDLGWRLPLAMWAGLALLALGVMAPQLRRHTVVPSGQDDLRVDHHSFEDRPWRSPWHTALGWQITAFMGIQSIGYYIFITWLPSIERAAGTSETAAGAHQFLLNGCAIIGSVACSALIPRLHDQRTLAAGVPVITLTAGIGLLTAPAWGALWACMIGAAGGVTIVLSLSFFGLRTRHHSQASDLSGMAQCVGYLFAAAGPVAIGALHDTTGSWTPALLVSIALQAVLSGFGYLAGRNRFIS